MSHLSTVGIIGTINYDKVLSDGFQYEDLGGIMFNILGIHYLSGGKVRIKPVANFGFDIRDSIERHLAGKANIDRSGLHELRTKNPLVELRDAGPDGKEESLKYAVRSLSYRKISCLLGCDIILVNFISGRDVELATLRKLRGNYPGIIYMDVHSLTLGRRRNGQRFYRCPENWRETLGIADILQMNLKEAATLLGRSEDIEQLNDTQIDSFGKELMAIGVKAVVLTMGHKGAKLFCRNGASVDIHAAKPVPTESPTGEATGCGDIFTSGFIVSLLSGGVFIDSLDYAVQVATEKFKRPGLKGVSELGELRRSF